jgi:methionyl-tRNA formyltransferase
MTESATTSQASPHVRDNPASRGLQVILFTNLSPVYGLARSWAARHGHTLKLVVTTPGPTARRSNLYRALIEAAPPEQEILVTTRMRRLALHVAPLLPDLIVSCSFPYRIPAEVIALPRLGAYNVHPAPLPRHRGPNAMRQVYEGLPLGATVHRTEAEFDAGPVLYRQEVPLPEDASVEKVTAALASVISQVWEEGLARAIAGAPGEPQNDAEATYAAPFSDDERWLDWSRPKAVLQRQATALNLFGPQARAHLADRPVLIERLDPLPERRPTGPDGEVVARDADSSMVLVADGLVRIRARPLTD